MGKKNLHIILLIQILCFMQCMHDGHLHAYRTLFVDTRWHLLIKYTYNVLWLIINGFSTVYKLALCNSAPQKLVKSYLT